MPAMPTASVVRTPVTTHTAADALLLLPVRLPPAGHSPNMSPQRHVAAAEWQVRLTAAGRWAFSDVAAARHNAEASTLTFVPSACTGMADTLNDTTRARGVTVPVALPVDVTLVVTLAVDVALRVTLADGLAPMDALPDGDVVGSGVPETDTDDERVADVLTDDVGDADAPVETLAVGDGVMDGDGEAEGGTRHGLEQECQYTEEGGAAPAPSTTLMLTVAATHSEGYGRHRRQPWLPTGSAPPAARRPAGTAVAFNHASRTQAYRGPPLPPDGAGASAHSAPSGAAALCSSSVALAVVLPL